MAPETLPDPLQVALEVGHILDRLDVGWLVAGSLASSLHGEPRSTNDVDVIADLQPRNVEPLLAALGDRYYADRDALAEAVRQGTTCNVIHLATAVKVDLFVTGQDPFDAARLQARLRVTVGPGPTDHLWVDTAEHTVVRKLEWYRRGDHVSDRQWRDVVSIVRAQQDTLDWPAMRAWAERLRVEDLLERARAEGTTPGDA